MHYVLYWIEHLLKSVSKWPTVVSSHNVISLYVREIENRPRHCLTKPAYTSLPTTHWNVYIRVIKNAFQWDGEELYIVTVSWNDAQESIHFIVCFNYLDTISCTEFWKCKLDTNVMFIMHSKINCILYINQKRYTCTCKYQYYFILKNENSKIVYKLWSWLLHISVLIKIII